MIHVAKRMKVSKVRTSGSATCSHSASSSSLHMHLRQFVLSSSSTFAFYLLLLLIVTSTNVLRSTKLFNQHTFNAARQACCDISSSSRRAITREGSIFFPPCHSAARPNKLYLPLLPVCASLLVHVNPVSV